VARFGWEFAARARRRSTRLGRRSTMTTDVWRHAQSPCYLSVFALDGEDLIVTRARAPRAHGLACRYRLRLMTVA